MLSAVYLSSGKGFAVDGDIEVIDDLKRGALYRFRSGMEWVLLPVGQVVAWVYDEKPENEAD
jgi:hypothetical protein